MCVISSLLSWARKNPQKCKARWGPVERDQKQIKIEKKIKNTKLVYLTPYQPLFFLYSAEIASYLQPLFFFYIFMCNLQNLPFLYYHERR